MPDTPQTGNHSPGVFAAGPDPANPPPPLTNGYPPGLQRAREAMGLPLPPSPPPEPVPPPPTIVAPADLDTSPARGIVALCLRQPTLRRTLIADSPASAMVAYAVCRQSPQQPHDWAAVWRWLVREHVRGQLPEDPARIANYARSVQSADAQASRDTAPLAELPAILAGIESALADERGHLGDNRAFSYVVQPAMNAAIAEVLRTQQPGGYVDDQPDNLRRSLPLYDAAAAAVPMLRSGIPDGPTGYRWRSAAELVAARPRVEYLIEHFLPAGVPGVWGGRAKTLKTTLALYAAVCLTTGRRFLQSPQFGGFVVPEPVNVNFISGESGGVVIAETLARIAAELGVALNDRLQVSEDLPVVQFVREGIETPESRQSIDWLVRDCERRQVRVCFLDPWYLIANVGDSAGNIYSMGARLRALGERFRRIGCALHLIHHFRKNSASELFEPPELVELSHSGVAEFAGFWALIGSRQRYESDGHFRLWFSHGSRDGSQGCLAVDVQEHRAGPSMDADGVPRDPRERVFRLGVRTEAAARGEMANVEAAAREQAEHDRRERQQHDDDAIVLAQFSPATPEHTARAIQELTGLSLARSRGACNRLVGSLLLSRGQVQTNRGRQAGYILGQPVAGNPSNGDAVSG